MDILMSQFHPSPGATPIPPNTTDATAIDLLTIDAKGLQSLLADRELTSLDLVRQCLAQIQRHDGYLHALIKTTPIQILEDTARLLDRERAVGILRGPLHGIPILVKVRLSRVTC
jgi:amidase